MSFRHVTAIMGALLIFSTSAVGGFWMFDPESGKRWSSDMVVPCAPDPVAGEVTVIDLRDESKSAGSQISEDTFDQLSPPVYVSPPGSYQQVIRSMTSVFAAKGCNILVIEGTSTSPNRRPMDSSHEIGLIIRWGIQPEPGTLGRRGRASRNDIKLLNSIGIYSKNRPNTTLRCSL